MERVGELPIAPDVEPGEIRAKLPAHAPEEPEPFEALMQDLDEVVLPGITHWQAPGWFAWFPANASPPSILAELVSAGLGAQGMIWASSPALTEIEAHVLDWLVDLLGLPQHFKTAIGPGGGVIQMSASDSTHLVHVVAREQARGGHGPARRVRVLAGALVGRARGEARGLRARPQARRRRRVRAAARGARARRSSRTAPTACIPRSSRAPSARPAPAPSTRSRPSRTSPASTASGTTSTPPGPARRCSARSTATASAAPSGPIATRSTRTSGCSRTSTATCCGWPTASR